ncbi:MAG TPA: hypothetical protein VK619_06450 [Pyrinomonadaceae bacterium]|nr:hypothetical protein [Pyrinomonadaceae bacterium]
MQTIYSRASRVCGVLHGLNHQIARDTSLRKSIEDRASIQSKQGTAPFSIFPERGEKALRAHECARLRSLASSHTYTFNITTARCSEPEAHRLAVRINARGACACS